MSRLISTLFCVYYFLLLSSATPVKKKDTSVAVSQTLRSYYKRQTSSTCECGVGDRKRIVGGEQSKQYAYPWLVAVCWTTGDLMCGGSIINNRYVLSASHCFPGISVNDIFLILGDYDRSTTTDGFAVQMGVKQIIMHEKFGLATKVDSDIALVKTTRVIQYSDRIQPICLPMPGEKFNGETGVVAGWGTTSFGGTESDMLLEVDAPILTDDICKNNFSNFYDSSNMMCAGHLDGGKDACQGDSGGPLFLPDEHNVYSVAGVISFGRGCATPGYPGVYAKVTAFLGWIKQKTAGSQECHKPQKEPIPSCGVANSPKRKKRIVGGSATTANQYPWTAVLILKSSTGRFQLRCGATLISNLYLLTTARCVHGTQTADLSVVLGEHDISKYEGKEVQRLLSSVTKHPNFNPNNAFTHDIAILEMKTVVTFNDYISPVCLPPESWNEASLLNITAVASGWGQNDKKTSVEQHVPMTIISNRICRVSYGPNLHSGYLCAGGVKGEDICNNDFGGQLSVTSVDEQYRIVGIAAFSEKDNCGNGHPAGFTRVTSYLPWIHQTTGIVVDLQQ